MKKHLAIAAILLFVPLFAFAHSGHLHTYMGSVTMLHADASFMMKTTAGKELTILTSPKTQYTHADGHVATKKELAVGSRVVVKMTADGKTAALVKMTAPKKR